MCHCHSSPWLVRIIFPPATPSLRLQHRMPRLILWTAKGFTLALSLCETLVVPSTRQSRLSWLPSMFPHFPTYQDSSDVLVVVRPLNSFETSRRVKSPWTSLCWCTSLFLPTGFSRVPCIRSTLSGHARFSISTRFSICPSPPSPFSSSELYILPLSNF